MSKIKEASTEKLSADLATIRKGISATTNPDSKRLMEAKAAEMEAELNLRANSIAAPAPPPLQNMRPPMPPPMFGTRTTDRPPSHHQQPISTADTPPSHRQQPISNAVEVPNPEDEASRPTYSIEQPPPAPPGQPPDSRRQAVPVYATGRAQRPRVRIQYTTGHSRVMGLGRLHSSLRKAIRDIEKSKHYHQGKPLNQMQTFQTARTYYAALREADKQHSPFADLEGNAIFQQIQNT